MKEGDKIIYRDKYRGIIFLQYDKYNFIVRFKEEDAPPAAWRGGTAKSGQLIIPEFEGYLYYICFTEYLSEVEKVYTDPYKRELYELIQECKKIT